MEKELKTQIVQAAAAVKKKVNEMRMAESNNEKFLDTFFQPITKPFHQIINDNSTLKQLNVSKNKNICEQLNNTHFKNKETLLKSPYNSDEEIDESSSDSEASNKSLPSNSSFATVESLQSPKQNTSSWSLSSEVFEDVPYGVRRERGKLMMGSSRVNVDDDNVYIAGESYQKTPGLFELLFKKIPDLSLVSENDSQVYKAMLQETNAHRRDYDRSKPIKTNRGIKYLRIIKPLFKLRKPSTSSVSSCKDQLTEGEGLTIKKKFKKYTDYVYWDDPNELVERLKLLIASKDAGNTGVNNEIISIVEELRENGHIN